MQKIILFLFLILGLHAKASQIIVPMDAGQSNHLKAYGAAFYVLENEVVIEWLLNYRGGAFLMPHLTTIEDMLIIRGVSYEILADGQVDAIKAEIANPEVNQEVVQLELHPKLPCIRLAVSNLGTMPLL